MILADSVVTKLSGLEVASNEFGMPLAQALQEKTDELRLRLFLRCIPNDRLKEADHEQFLKEVLGKSPGAELLLAIADTGRGPRLAEDELIALEESQGGRCALCGCLLTATAGPQVDHIVPIALKGKSELGNYQLLCQHCNVGKSKLVGWIMGAPFLGEGRGPSLKLRYCALARSNGQCDMTDCSESARTAELEVVPRIPMARGGRWIFDNLMVICGYHARVRELEQLERAKEQVKRARFRSGLFNLPFGFDQLH